jgi:hypothetical protein
MRFRTFTAAVAIAGVVLAALAGPARAQRTWGVHKNHFGVYTTPRRGPVLPWHRPQAVSPEGAAPRGRTSRGFLPWQQPVAPNPVPRVAVPHVAPYSWSTRSYVLDSGYGLWHHPWHGTHWGGTGYGWRSGAGVAWTYGLRRKGSFIFSTRRGLAGFSIGRFGFSMAW